ncbi:hypothetical protein FOA52_015323 [Chlamydomonas sp. UWO 241]|nr:hypothetical protein FOA52_015323 [Chlamydomonas sp. UWO 241]
MQPGGGSPPKPIRSSSPETRQQRPRVSSNGSAASSHQGSLAASGGRVWRPTGPSSTHVPAPAPSSVRGTGTHSAAALTAEGVRGNVDKRLAWGSTKQAVHAAHLSPTSGMRGSVDKRPVWGVHQVEAAHLPPRLDKSSKSLASVASRFMQSMRGSSGSGSGSSSGSGMAAKAKAATGSPAAGACGGDASEGAPSTLGARKEVEAAYRLVDLLTAQLAAANAAAEAQRAVAGAQWEEQEQQQQRQGLPQRESTCGLPSEGCTHEEEVRALQGAVSDLLRDNDDLAAAALQLQAVLQVRDATHERALASMTAALDSAHARLADAVQAEHRALDEALKLQGQLQGQQLEQQQGGLHQESGVADHGWWGDAAAGDAPLKPGGLAGAANTGRARVLVFAEGSVGAQAVEQEAAEARVQARQPCTRVDAGVQAGLGEGGMSDMGTGGSVRAREHEEQVARMAADLEAEHQQRVGAEATLAQVLGELQARACVMSKDIAEITSELERERAARAASESLLRARLVDGRQCNTPAGSRGGGDVECDVQGVGADSDATGPCSHPLATSACPSPGLDADGGGGHSRGQGRQRDAGAAGDGGCVVS